MKKFLTFLCVGAAILSMMNFSALAAAPDQRVIDLGDGFYAVETISQSPTGRSGGSVSGNKTRNIYSGSTLIGIATLNGTFDISGSSAKATDAYIAGTGKNGGAYLRGTTRLSGNTAYGTAYFSYNGAEKSVNISLSCSSDGTIS